MTINACPQCGGKFIKHGGESTTLVGFLSSCPQGDHDDNCLKRLYVCENEHTTLLSVRRSCPCGWKGKESCFCHKPHEKVDAWPDGDGAGPTNREEFFAFYKQYDK